VIICAISLHITAKIGNDTLLNIKVANLNHFLKLNNILLFLTSMCVKMYYFNTKYVAKRIITSN